MYISRKTAKVEKPHIAYCLSLLHLTKPNSLPCLPGDVVCQIYSFLHVVAAPGAGLIGSETGAEGGEEALKSF